MSGQILCSFTACNKRNDDVAEKYATYEVTRPFVNGQGDNVVISCVADFQV